eukprot:jgi/Psemu1/220113/e_gw1.1016.8.1
MISHRVLLPWAILAILIFVQTLLPLCSGFIGSALNQGRIAATKNTGTSQLSHRILLNRSGRRRISGSRKRPAELTTTATRTAATQLFLHPTAGASLALIGSSLFGMQLTRRVPSGGILGTLLSAAFCGNVLTQWVPNHHPLYDLCFTLFLPGSLTLMLLAYRPPKKVSHEYRNGTKMTISTSTKSQSSNAISACIRRVAMPFLIASSASLLGCWLSFRCALAFQWFQNGGKTADALAKITMGCMSASYVGGTVNFMSTARLVGAPADLLGSLITADLFTMAIYFSFLSSSLDWEWLVSKFSNTRMIPTTEGGIEQDEMMAKDKTQQEAPTDKVRNLEPLNESISSSSVQSKRNSALLASVPLLVGTFLIVQVANRVQDIVGEIIPGTACALIAIVAPLLNSLVQSKDFWAPFSKAASVWSDFLFLSFFASIGVAANLSSALAMGPACLLFSAIALSTHVVGTVVGSLLWKRVMIMLAGHNRSGSLPSLDLEDVWIASNAAIGGPATAAAFCGQMKKSDPEKLQGRTISATVWGVVGYAIGTMVGVGMYRMV